MSSLFKRRNGSWVMQFCLDERRPTLVIGLVSKRTAEAVRSRVDELVESKAYDIPPDPKLVQWASSVKSISAQLALLGLAVESAPVKTLGELVEQCKVVNRNLKPASRHVYGHTYRNLLAFFGADRSLTSITGGCAEEFRTWLATSGRRFKKGGSGPLAPTTVSKRCKTARQFFRLAMLKRWIDENPFGHMKQWVDFNEARLFFVPVAAARKIIKSLPNFELKLIFALLRWGGLRAEEPKHLMREWVTFDRSRFKVYSSKTERHGPSYKFRHVPVFPELRAHLKKAVSESLKADSEYLCPWYRKNTAQAFRQRLLASMAAVGVEPWPKLLQNLRATRSTEVNKIWGIKCEQKWIGHGEDVARKSYLIVNDSDFEAAAKGVSSK